MNDPLFRFVSETEFDAAIRSASTTELFRQQLARFTVSNPDGADFAIHDGALTIDGDFRPPAFLTLVTGDLTVSGLIDLENPNQDDFDGGGRFIVTGNVTCRSMVGEYGKQTFIDGDLIVSDILAGSQEHSAIVVTGLLVARFFMGVDIWIDVGDGADIEYGWGHCLPIGYVNAERQAIRPRIGREASLALLNSPVPDGQTDFWLDERLREGYRLFSRA